MRKLSRLVAVSFFMYFASPASAAWHEAKSKHFIIFANESEAEIRAYAEKLERFDQAVRYIRKMGDPPLTDAGRVTIFALTNESAIEKLTGYQGIRGLYESTAAGSTAFVPRRSGMRMVQGMSNGTGTEKDTLTGEAVFLHEYAHHLQLQQWSGVMPAWVSEGFAEFFATADMDQAGNVTIGKFPSWRSWEVFLGTGLSAEDMVAADFDKLQWYESIALYGRAWLLTHYLNLSDGRKGQLGRYLEGLDKGMRPIDSAKAAFGDLKLLSKDLDAYAAPRNFLAFTIDGKVLSPGSVSVRALSPGEAAMMPSRMRSKYKYEMGTGTAREIANQARSAAAPFPSEPTVQGYLAEAEFDGKNYAAAEAAADRALAVNPAAVQALVYKGKARMALAKASPQSADWKQIRALFLKANNLDTENAEPLALFFETFAAAGERPTKNAVDALIYAIDLAPQDDDLRRTVTRQLLADGRVPEAKSMFAAVAYNPHGEKKERAANSRIMAAIARGDTKDAIALIDAKIEEERKKKA